MEGRQNTIVKFPPSMKAALTLLLNKLPLPFVHSFIHTLMSTMRKVLVKGIEINVILFRLSKETLLRNENRCVIKHF